MDIKEIITAIPVNDVDRAQNFYSKTLGFELETLSRNLDMYWAKSNNGKLLLYKREDENLAEHTALSLTVENIEDSVKELEEKGVVFHEVHGQKIFDLDGSLSAWFKDPEGNNLEISERPQA